MLRVGCADTAFLTPTCVLPTPPLPLEHTAFPRKSKAVLPLRSRVCGHGPRPGRGELT